MNLSLSAGAMLVLLASSLVAQPAVLPKGYGTKEGEYSRHVPLRYNSARIQCGFGPKATGWLAPRVMRELWVRADSTGYLNTAFSVDCQVWLSSNGCDPLVASMVFNKNHGIDKILFMKRKAYNFQPFSKVSTPPAKWSVQLKGDRVFVAIKPTLVIDWATYARGNQSNVNFYVDAARVTGQGQGTRGRVTYYGTACNPTTFYNYATGYNEGENFRTYGYTRGVGDVATCWLGPSRTSIPVGGSCTVYTLPALFHWAPVITTATSGYANFPWVKVPKGWGGRKVYSQMVGFSKTAGMRLSRGVEILFGDYRTAYPFTIAHKYNYSSGSRVFNPDKDNALYGWENTAIVFDVR